MSDSSSECIASVETTSHQSTREVSGSARNSTSLKSQPDQNTGNQSLRLDRETDRPTNKIIESIKYKPNILKLKRSPMGQAEQSAVVGGAAAPKNMFWPKADNLIQNSVKADNNIFNDWSKSSRSLMPEPISSRLVVDNQMPEYQSDRSALFSFKLEMKNENDDQRHLSEDNRKNQRSRDHDGREPVSGTVTSEKIDKYTLVKPNINVIDSNGVFDPFDPRLKDNNTNVTIDQGGEGYMEGGCLFLTQKLPS